MAFQYKKWYIFNNPLKYSKNNLSTRGIEDILLEVPPLTKILCRWRNLTVTFKTEKVGDENIFHPDDCSYILRSYLPCKMYKLEDILELLEGIPEARFPVYGKSPIEQKFDDMNNSEHIIGENPLKCRYLSETRLENSRKREFSPLECSSLELQFDNDDFALNEINIFSDLKPDTIRFENYTDFSTIITLLHEKGYIDIIKSQYALTVDGRRFKFTIKFLEEQSPTTEQKEFLKIAIVDYIDVDCLGSSLFPNLSEYVQVLCLNLLKEKYV
jgi:hypothetical protein